MGPSRYGFSDPEAPHFMTCSILDWTPFFTRPDTVEIVLDRIRFLQRDSGLKLYGYVIFENHMHWIAQSVDLPSDVKPFKSYTARKIVDYFEEFHVRGVLDKTPTAESATSQAASIRSGRKALISRRSRVLTYCGRNWTIST